MPRPVRMIDLFAGAGGLSEGFRQAGGYEVGAAVESDGDAVTTFERNHPGVAITRSDVRDLRGDDLLELARGEVDLLVGGPPCQGFSVKGQRDPAHPSTELLLEFARLVEEIRPRGFLIENVPGLLSFRRGLVIDRLVQRLNRVRIDGQRYAIVLDTLDAACFGVPQHRRRVFICGVLGRPVTLPVGGPERVTLEQAIGDLPAWTAPCSEPPDDAIPLPKAYPLTRYQRDRRLGAGALYNHTAKRLQEVRQERISWLQEGDDKRALPAHLQAGGHEGKYRKLRRNAPSPTILAHMAKDTSAFIHPYHGRMLTVREAARLQSFNDAYQFWGSQYQQFRQIGNAVPPLLAQALAESLRPALQWGSRQRRGALAASRRKASA